MAEAHSPLDQFKVSPIAEMQIAGYDTSFTNSAMWMVVGLAVMTIFLIGGSRRSDMVPGRWQTLVEMSYGFVAGMIKDNVGREGKQYFPFIFTLFMFVLAANVLGMVPYSFTTTSHIVVTFALAGVVITGITLIGLLKHGLGFLKLFAPSGLPAPLYLIIVPIEIISYLTRPVSLSVRLFANMLAGHIIMKIFAMFVVSLGAAGGVLSVLAIAPFALNIFMTGLELLVAFLQAYVFTILTCIYLNDAMHPSH